MEMLGSCQFQLICFFCLLVNSSVSAKDFQWKKDATFDNKLSEAGYNVKARSRLHCSRTCSANNTCVSFFFAPGQDMNCQLHDSILTPSVGLKAVSSSKYYILDGASQQTTSQGPDSLTSLVPTSSETDSVTTLALTSPVSDTGSTFVQTSPKSESSSTAPLFSCPTDDSTFRTVKLQDGSHFTYRVKKYQQPQAQAAAMCEQESGFLARVTTAAKMNMLLQLTNCTDYSGKEYYVGGSNANATDFTAADSWKMANGDPVPMTDEFWAENKPNDPENEHCLRMDKDKNYKWNDCDCESSSYYFICERN